MSGPTKVPAITVGSSDLAGALSAIIMLLLCSEVHMSDWPLSVLVFETLFDCPISTTPYEANPRS